MVSTAGKSGHRVKSETRVREGVANHNHRTQTVNCDENLEFIEITVATWPKYSKTRPWYEVMQEENMRSKTLRGISTLFSRQPWIW